MILLAALFGIAACILAYAIASRLDASIAGCIAVTNAVLFATAAVLKRVIGITY
jgi:ABC-type Mn2+/Zn2+ transport system permease subunit